MKDPITPNYQLIEFLYQAAASPCGIAIATNDPADARLALYQQRTSLGDPALAVLKFSPSPTAPDQELWITKRAAPSAPANGAP